MATLLLTAVGNAVAGPIGGFLGAIAGRAVDSQVFGIGNRTVEGPRKDDLSVQSAAFGKPIALVYGTGRYAGNVLWSTGLLETREEETQGGKGGPTVTNVTYTYSASFAVGLCAGPIEGIGRIWADGKLIREAGGELSVGGVFRVYLGDEDQLPDTLIEGELGVGQTPAFRGIAYCVFETLALAEFANRIPNLTFEVLSASAPKIIDVAADILARAGIATILSGTSDSVEGYSISGGESLRDGLNGLLDVFDLLIVTDETGATLTPPAATPVATLTLDDLGTAAPGEQSDQITIDYDHSADLPEEVRLAYSDPANDYQPGFQRAQTAGIALGIGSQRINTSFVLETAQARRLAIQTLSHLRQERASVQFRAGLNAMRFEPGDVIAIDADLGTQTDFRIDQIVEEGLSRTITAAALPVEGISAAGTLPATPGLVDYSASAAAPAIAAQAFELPATRQFGDSPKIFASVARLGGTIRSAGLYISDDGGLDYRLDSTLPVAGVTGICINGLEDRNPALIDRASVLEVALDSPDMALAGRPWLAILNGANVAMVGTELLQFESAELTQSGTYRLSGLLRGRGGTEGALMGPATGQLFVLLRSGDLGVREFAAGDVGSVIPYKIAISGEVLADVPAQAITLSGRALRPLSPVHLSAAYDAGSGLDVSWIRRSRSGYAWQDLVDAPLGEDSLSFEVDYTSGGNAINRQITSESDTVTAADLTTAFGAAPYDLSITIRQVSAAVGPGDPATLTLSIPV